MAVLAAEALKNDTFRSICSSETIQTEFGAPPYKRWLKNTNKLLTMYDGVYGVKTGFTDEAGRCLVSACERDGKDLICVTLNDRNDWNDHMALYDYGFQTARTLEVPLPADISADIVGGSSEKFHLSAKESTVSVTTSAGDISDFEFTVIGQPFLYAPVSAGEEAGKLRVSFMGREVETVPLYADEDIAFEKKCADRKSLFAKIKENLGRFFSP